MHTRCPSCKNPVPPGAEDCPHCPMSFRTPMIDQHRQRGLAALTRHPAVPLASALVAAWFGWLGLRWVLNDAIADAPNDTVTRAFSVNARLEAQTRAARTGEQPAGPGAPAGPRAPISADRPDEARPEESVTVVADHGPRAPRERPVTEWRLRGTVYDLISLKPVAGCRVTFADTNTGARVETSTDDGGQYRAVLVPLSRGGYAVTLQHPDFAPSYLNPGVEGVAGLGEAKRKSMAAELSHSIEEPYLVQPMSARPLVTDFYVAPR